MAEIILSNDLAMPSTPTKNGIIDSAPSYTTPAPKYTQSVQNPLFEGQSKAESSSIQMMPDHPVYPRGDIFYDIRNHLRCYSVFNANIETLLSQYSSMKIEWEKATLTISKLTREVHTERSLKESYLRQCEGLKTALRQSQDDLIEVRRDLVETQNKLSSSITQLAEVARRLETARSELRSVIRERDELILRITDKDEEIKFLGRRISELNISLELAIGAEKEANERNSRLTELLLQIERVKVTIENERDASRRERDELRERLKEVETGFGRLEREARIHDLETRHFELDFMIVELNDKLRHSEQQFKDRGKQLEDEQRRSAEFYSYYKALIERIDDYNDIVQELPIDHRSKFPEMEKRTMLDGTTLMPEFRFEKPHILSTSAKPAATGANHVGGTENPHVDPPVHSTEAEETKASETEPTDSNHE